MAAALVLAAFPASAEGFRRRGVLEGFYGEPWTWRTRGEMIDWMARRGMNLFVIAPKDEPLQRADWRRPLPRGYLERLGALQRQAKARGVALAWTLSPEQANLKDSNEVRLAAAKFRSVLGRGVRQLAIAFDDTPPDEGQVAFANAVLAALAADHHYPEMTFVPSLYWGEAAPSPYLERLAQELDPRFLVGWTGPKILSETISAEQGRRFRDYIRHRLVLGDNYPVQDRLHDSGPLYLGPLVGREAGLAETQEAFLSNASPLAEASKVPLQTAADFARDPRRYDPERSWKRALSDNRVPETLARECANSWISPEPEDWIYRRTLAFALEESRTGQSRRLRERLAEASTQIPVHAELKPWAAQLAALSRAARRALDGGGPSTNWGAESPAVVADLALERLRVADGRPSLAPLPSLRVLRRAGDSPEALELARRAVHDLAEADSFLPPNQASPADWTRQLAPWFEVLAQSARRAQSALDDTSSRTRVPAWLWRISARARFLPLLASRALLEGFADSVERSWNSAVRLRKTGWLALWLWMETIVKPSAFPAVLSKRLKLYRQTGDPAGLLELFGYLENFPRLARAQARRRMIPDVGPWLTLVAGYGRLGRLCLELDELARKGEAPSPRQRADFRSLRGRLSSSNGLELAARLNYALGEFARWRRLPARRRPSGFKVDWPADPGRLL